MEEINNFGENADIKPAIMDIALEYGLLSNYTSMVVMRDEMYDTYGIKRTNQQRLKTEHAAQQQRAQQPSVSHRVDKNQRMF